MMAHTFREGWQQSSVLVKSALIAVALIVLAALAIGGKSWWQNRAYEKREAARVAEREQLITERQELQRELERQKGEIAEQEAIIDTLKQVAATKRADRDAAVKDIEKIEAEHAANKQAIEAGGGIVSDSDLKRELCERLRARGYKLTCAN